MRLIAAHGRDGFYKGANAEALIREAKERGVEWTAADLGDYKAEWVEPLLTATVRPARCNSIAAISPARYMRATKFRAIPAHPARREFIGTIGMRTPRRTSNGYPPTRLEHMTDRNSDVRFWLDTYLRKFGDPGFTVGPRPASPWVVTLRP